MSNNTCTICNKSFATPRGLRSHLLWHNPNYAAACSNNGESISKGVRYKAEQKRIIAENIYLTSPKHCKQCSVVLPYDKRGNSYCGHSCSAAYSNIPRTKPKKESMRLIWKRNRILIICQECNTSFSVSPGESSRKYCSVGCSNKNKYHPNSTRKKTCIYKGYRMDSGAEHQFALLLDKHCISWVKNTETYFPFVDSSGKTRKYYPDFYLKDYDHWVEIKGERYIREDDDLRLASVGNIERIMSDNICLPKCALESVAGMTGFEPA